MIRLVLALWLFALPALAQDQRLPPVPPGPVSDLADILDAETEARLDARLAALAAGTGVELAVLTIASRDAYTPGGTIEDFATAVFNAWGIGDAERNDGVLILVARDDREMRLELGAGYPTSYDWLAEAVVDQAILPQFRDGQMARGIEAGVEAAITRIVTPFAEGRTPEQPPPTRAVETGEGGGLGLWLFLLFGGAIALLPIARSQLRKLRPCPTCGKRHLSQQRHVVAAASTLNPGFANETSTCRSCGWTETRQVTLPKTSKRRSGGSSGGSFGGGRSSGGGATGRW